MIFLADALGLASLRFEHHKKIEEEMERRKFQAKVASLKLASIGIIYRIKDPTIGVVVQLPFAINCLKGSDCVPRFL